MTDIRITPSPYGRWEYVPSGGCVLTTEQVEDARTAANCALQYGNIASREAAARLNYSLPATEPAEQPCTGNLWCDAPLHAEGCYATHRIPPGRLTPAVPAEEEAKAEDLICPCRGRFGFHECNTIPASSPVVPAPTETGPWQRWQEVPDGVEYWSKRQRHHRWVNNNGHRLFRSFDGRGQFPSEASEREMQNRAPFVAAEEKDA